MMYWLAWFQVAMALSFLLLQWFWRKRNNDTEASSCLRWALFSAVNAVFANHFG